MDGNGSTFSPLMVVGEAPVREDDKVGSPFVGQGGKLLRGKLNEIYSEYGLDPTLIYYTNAVRCRPPNNRDPLPDELRECLPWLVDEIEEIQPKCILAVGRFAQLQATKAIETLYPKCSNRCGCDGVCADDLGVIKRAFHPSYILRRKAEMGNWIEQLRIAVRRAWDIPWDQEKKVLRFIRPDELGEPDYESEWLSADTETDSLEDGIGNARVGYSVSDSHKAIFRTDEPPKMGHVFLHEASYDLPLLGINPDDLESYDDTLIQAYVTRRFQYVGLKKITPLLTDLTWEYTLGDHTGKRDGLLKADVTVTKTLKSGKTKESTKRVDIPFSQALLNDYKKASEYAATDALATALDAQALSRLLDSLPWARKYYDEIEKPLIPVIVSMQQAGVRIDPIALEAAATPIHEELERTKALLQAEFGPDVNINSNQQMGPLLLARDMIDGKLTKSGNALGVAVKNVLGAFGVERKEDLPNDARGDLARLWFTYAEMEKLESTYIVAIRENLDANSRVHGRFNQASTNTNRLSSNDPNLQNIPARSKAGLAIRRAFIAREGCKLVVGDFSQLQLRDIAEIVGDDILINTYVSPTECRHIWIPWHESPDDRVQCHKCRWVEGDYHGEIARELNRARKVMKNFNFAYAFGAEADKAALTAGIPLDEMKPFMLVLKERLPRLASYRQQIADILTQQGYVESLQGWHMFFPDWASTVDKWRAAALREAVCGTIQATEAGTVKRFMVATYHLCKRYDAQIVLQVHDELGIEVPEERVSLFVPEWEELGKEIGMIDLKRVPLRLSVKVADNWAEAK